MSVGDRIDGAAAAPLRNGEGQLDRLRGVLPPALADKVLAAGGEALLETHRREIAVLFADLRGFTAFTETAEPEDVLGVLRDFHQAVGQLAQRYEASLGDFAGDGVMAYFNDPLPVPDPAVRAVRMAAGLRRAFGPLKERWRNLGRQIDVGVGIAMGYATLGMLGPEPRSEYKPVGTVVNLAARLCADAEPGQILISQRVRTEADGVIDVEPAGELSLKGIHRPVHAYRVAAVVDAEELRTAELRQGRSKMVGRDPQLHHLDLALADAMRGAGRLVLVSGEPGIGKTRLAEETARRGVAAGAGVVWGRCSDRAGAPAFWPWMQLIEGLVDKTDAATVRSALGSTAGVVAQIVPAINDLVPDGGAPPALEPEAARFRLYRAVTSFVSRLAKQRPVVIVVEDLHWADVPSLQLLAYFTGHLKDAGVLVVGTYRDVDPVVGPPLSDTLAELAREPVTSRLSLPGLACADVARYMADVCGTAPSMELVAQVHGRTEGNPFFVGELVRLLASEANDGDLAGAEKAASIPDGVRDVILRRVSRLPEVTADLLRTASVAGREIDLDVLIPFGGLDPEATLDALAPALEARMVMEAAGVPGRYRFSHALVNQTLYEEIGTIARARLHRRLGEVMEDQYGESDEVLSQLAHHFLLAVPAGGSEKAYGYAVRAAEWAEGRLAYEQAEDHLRRALGLTRRMPPPERPRRELEVQMRLILLFTTTRGYGADDVVTALVRSRQLAIELQDNGTLAVCLWGLCAFHTTRGEYEPSRGFAEEARVFGERAGDEVLTMAGDWALGMIAFCRGQLALARDAYRRAIGIADRRRDPSLAERFGQDPSTNSRVFLALVEWLRGNADEAERLIAEAISTATTNDNKLSLANAVLFDAMLGAFADDADRAWHSARRTIALCEGHGFGLFHTAARVLRGWAVARQGDPAAGGAEIDEAARALVEGGTPMLHHFHLALRADAFRIEGKPEQALRVIDEAFEFVEEAGGLFWEAELHRLRGRALLELSPPRTAEADAAFESALAAAQGQGARPLASRASRELRPPATSELPERVGSGEGSAGRAGSGLVSPLGGSV